MWPGGGARRRKSVAASAQPPIARPKPAKPKPAPKPKPSKKPAPADTDTEDDEPKETGGTAPDGVEGTTDPADIAAASLPLPAPASCGDTAVPAFLIPIYQEASRTYGLGPSGPSILAAINEIETGFGVNQGPSIAGAIGYAVAGLNVPSLPPWSVGFVYLPAFLGISITSVLVAPFGARLAHRLKGPTLRRIFAVFVIMVGG